MNPATPYSSWARYYDLIYARLKDYPAEAASLTRMIRKHNPVARSLLDVACGTGQHLRHFRRDFEVEGLDANPEFIDVVRKHSPGVRLHHGSMESFQLGTRYDVVTCMFSSIGFVRTRGALRKTIGNFAAHLNPGGMLFIEPWFSLAKFWPGRINAHFIDRPGLKIAWMYTTAVENNLSILSNEFLIGTPEGMERLTDTHVLGLFSPEDYVGAITGAGLVPLMSLDMGSEWKRGLYVAVRQD